MLLDEEDKESDKNTCIWVHEAWKKRATEGKYTTLHIELIAMKPSFLNISDCHSLHSTIYWEQYRMIYKSEIPVGG
jgi:hypothetical protein